MNWGRSTLSLVMVIGGLGVLPGSAAAQAATCPGTFHVLHNDAIGQLTLPAGAYTITVFNPANLSCTRASQNFAEFLQDFDGRLRRPWIVDPRTSTFSRGEGSLIRFTVARSGGSGGGGNNPSTNTCPGTFQVLHNDHIGRLKLKRGSYRLSLVNPQKLSCARASQNLAEFLQDYDGRLRRPWILASLNVATFTRGRGSDIGFRVKPATSRTPGGGGGTAGGECRGTFRVVNSTRIGSVRFKAGPYLTFPRKGSGLSCRRANAYFTQFLDQDFDGRLPSPWKLNGKTGTFTNGSKPGFRVKPAN